MDRTTIAAWKADEKERSEKLYKKLQGLALLYPMNDEMTKLLTGDTFLKSNQPAFFQVMHYLFRVLDPAEFKRRFFWPITDKKSEANFRSSTVDYLKHLNEKHHLQWANIKSHLVVMPGGMKFINFLLDLVGFVVQELTKQREKSLAADMDTSKIADLNVQQMKVQNEFMKEYTSAYIDELEIGTARYREGTKKIRQIFSAVAAKTGVEEALLTDDKFLEDFEAYNRRKCEENITLPAARIAKLEAPLCALKYAMDQFQTKQMERKHNKVASDNALRRICETQGTDVENITENALLSAFNEVSATIAEQLDANNHYHESNEFISNDLKNLRLELQQIELQVAEVQKNLNASAKNQSINISGNALKDNYSTVPELNTPLRSLDKRNQTLAVENPLLMKFVSTPPIKHDGSNSMFNIQVRLPLQEDYDADQFESTCNTLMAPAPPRSTRKGRPHQEHTSELNNTLNRSKIVDPMQLLRTINKPSAKAKAPTSSNLATLGSKWKQLQATFDFADDAPAVPASPKSNTAASQSPFTPLNCNEQTRIQRLPQTQTSDVSNSSMYAKKSAALMKVLDASLNVKDVSTSPSGRLDPLTPFPIAPRILIDGMELESQSSNKENIDKWLPPNFNLDLDEFGEDNELQNTSDSVLNVLD